MDCKLFDESQVDRVWQILNGAIYNAVQDLIQDLETDSYESIEKHLVALDGGYQIVMEFVGSLDCVSPKTVYALNVMFGYVTQTITPLYNDPKPPLRDEVWVLAKAIGKIAQDLTKWIGDAWKKNPDCGECLTNNRDFWVNPNYDIFTMNCFANYYGLAVTVLAEPLCEPVREKCTLPPYIYKPSEATPIFSLRAPAPSISFLGPTSNFPESTFVTAERPSFTPESTSSTANPTSISPEPTSAGIEPDQTLVSSIGLTVTGGKSSASSTIMYSALESLFASSSVFYDTYTTIAPDGEESTTAAPTYTGTGDSTDAGLPYATLSHEDSSTQPVVTELTTLSSKPTAFSSSMMKEGDDETLQTSRPSHSQRVVTSKAPGQETHTTRANNGYHMTPSWVGVVAIMLSFL